MGTRSLTFTYGSNGEKLLCMYRQYDGYPEGHGKELATILQTTLSNGMECLSASIVAKLKTGAYNIYVYPTNTRNAEQDYEYHIHANYVEVVKTYPKRHSIFKGTDSEFLNFCNSFAEV